MPLRSDLFRGDAKLENAALFDSAHIVPGSSGTHVGKIQLALTILDSAVIAPQELTNGLYRDSTAKAVLAYKTKRSIINKSYQSTADDIVGRMTMASLDDEMAKRPSIQRRCGCNYAPVGEHIGKQSFRAFMPVVAQVGAPSGATSTLDMALAAVPTALEMRRKAREALRAVIAGDGSAAAQLGLQALQTHYKASTKAEVDAVAPKVQDALAQVGNRLFSARAWLRQGGQSGGFAETPTPRDGHTYMLPGYASAGPLLRPTILIHEAFHDISDFNQDFGGNPAKDNGAAYHKNDTGTQLMNAYAMSQFVLHIHVGQERILNDTD